MSPAGSSRRNKDLFGAPASPEEFPIIERHKKDGANDWSRTSDLRITNAPVVLYLQDSSSYWLLYVLDFAPLVP
jgi:hypothetical protein